MAQEIISTRLRLPKGLHRLLTQTAKRNNRSFNSEVLWRLAISLGGEAPNFVEEMAVEQRRVLDQIVEKAIEQRGIEPPPPVTRRR
jgi:Arc-like DNA binding domain